MTTRRSLPSLALAGLMTTSLITAALLGTTSLAAETIKIGDINSYTRMAQHTEHAKRGMEMALAEINDAGGIGGKQLELISRDDAGEPGEAVRVAEELVTREGVQILTGTTLSNVGLAVASFAAQNQVLYLAAEPLADAVTLQSGNRYTFRLRPSTYMQASMLAELAVDNPATRWATIAPNYAYGQEAVAAFKAIMSEKRPDIEWVGEQWPALFNIDAGAEVQALAAAEPDAIFNVTFAADLAKLVREGSDRGLFDDVFVASLLTGEPEYIDPLEDEAPEGWLVTGYPWDKIEDPAYVEWLDRLRGALRRLPADRLRRRLQRHHGAGRRARGHRRLHRPRGADRGDAHHHLRYARRASSSSAPSTTRRRSAPGSATPRSRTAAAPCATGTTRRAPTTCRPRRW